MIKDNLNPNFAKSFLIDYIFEVKSELRFEVIDIDKNGFDYIGDCETTLGNVVGAKNQTVILDLLDKKRLKAGKIILRCEKVTTCPETLTM